MPERDTACSPSRDLEAIFEVYFFVALLSTSGLDNLLLLTILLTAWSALGQIIRTYHRRGR